MTATKERARDVTGVLSMSSSTVAWRTSAVVAEPMPDTDQAVAIALGEALGAVLVGGVGLGDTKRRELGSGCFHASNTAGVACEDMTV